MGILGHKGGMRGWAYWGMHAGRQAVGECGRHRIYMRWDSGGNRISWRHDIDEVAMSWAAVTEQAKAIGARISCWHELFGAVG